MEDNFLLLNGRAAADSIAARLRTHVSTLSLKPSLAIFQIGARPESTVYIKRKKEFAKKIGVEVRHIAFEERTAEKEIAEALQKVSADKGVHGIILQLPLPIHLNKENLIARISPEKDVDGLTPENQRLLREGKTRFVPATARGVAELLEFYKIPIRGKKIAVLGRSALVGAPTALLLVHHGGAVTVCHSQTPNTKEITRASDIVIVAIGKPHFITAEYFSGKQVVVDVGITAITKHGTRKLDEEIPRTKLVGDVDFENVRHAVSALSPVPGGVGPMTVAALFENLLDAYKQQQVS